MAQQVEEKQKVQAINVRIKYNEPSDYGRKNFFAAREVLTQKFGKTIYVHPQSSISEKTDDFDIFVNDILVHSKKMGHDDFATSDIQQKFVFDVIEEQQKQQLQSSAKQQVRDEDKDLDSYTGGDMYGNGKQPPLPNLVQNNPHTAKPKVQKQKSMQKHMDAVQKGTDNSMDPYSGGNMYG